MSFDWAFLADSRFIEALIAGLKVTILLTLYSAVGAVLIGLLLTTARIAGPRWVQRAARYYTDVARNTPMLITMFFLYFGSTNLFPPSEFTFLRTPHYGEIVVVLAISLAMGAFVSEVLRQGVESIPVGQVEAAMACGMESRSIYRHVIIPQLLPLVLPGLSSEIINVLKSTTFAMTLGVAESGWEVFASVCCWRHSHCRHQRRFASQLSWSRHSSEACPRSCSCSGCTFYCQRSSGFR